MKKTEETELELPWVEKYRPKRLSEVIGQTEIVKRLQTYSETKSMPHLLFSGPAGVGKTTSAVALANELYGEEISRNFCELNASDSRGIDVVRGQIKDFARTLAFNSQFKIIFLDEADALTSDAQQALRRTMEKFTRTTRFVLSCVTPDTKISLPEETETTIAEFVQQYEEKKEKEVLNIQEEKGFSKTDLVLCAIKQNPKSTGKRVFELSTNTGRKLKLTEDHLLLTENGWKAAGKIATGERIAVFPTLEGTGWPTDPRLLFDFADFRAFLEKTEISADYKTLTEAKSFSELCTADKRKVLHRAKELFGVIRSNHGLTPTEMKVFTLIKEKPGILRKEIQEALGLSRMRTVELLRAIEQKGLVKRSVMKKQHSFTAKGSQPIQLRNFRDIQNHLQAEFSLTLSYSNIKNHLENEWLELKSIEDSTVSALQKLGLLSLLFDSPQTPALIRILGFVFGDGHITKSRQRIIFTGNRGALEEVKKDLQRIGLKSSSILQKTLVNTMRGRTFTGTTRHFFVDSKPFGRLLEFLGAPIGDKIKTLYAVPPIVKNGNRLVKREFLRALFGCEGYSPKIKSKNFEAVTLRMHKSTELRENMLEFFIGLKNLLSEFQVDSYISIQKLGYTRKDGIKPECYSLILKSKNENQFRFFSRIGYAFETEKMDKARLAAEYLRYKNHLWQHQIELGADIRANLKTGITKRALAREFNCSVDFITNQSKNKAVHLKRNFPSFEAWKSNYHYKKGLVFNEVTQLKEIDANTVMDLTCHNDHNFIANGIVSHNCNYSSKIIEPIQSRCVVFRFKPLTSKEIEEALKGIAKHEGLQLEETGLKAIEYVSQGDLRKAINVLQAASSMNKTISEDNVFSVSSRARPEEIKQMIHAALNGRFSEAREKLDFLLYEHGMSGEDIILQLHRETMEMPEEELPSKTKIELVDIIGEYNFRMVEGANERIQLEALLAQFMKFKKG